MTLATILLVLALICFVLAAFGVNPPQIGLTPLGLAFLTSATLFAGVGRVG